MTTTITTLPTDSSLPRPPDSGRRRRRGPAQWCAEHRWRTLFAGLLVLAGAVVLLGGGLKTTAPADQLVGDSREAVEISRGADFGDRPTETVVVTRPSGVLDAAQVRAIGGELRRAYTGLPGVATVGRPTPSPDGRPLILAVGLDAVSSSDDDDDAAGAGAQGKQPGDVVAPMLAATSRL